MEVVKCPKCKTTMYRYFGNYFCENCTEFLAFGDAIPFSEFKVFEVKMEKPKEDAICPNCGASDWKLSYSTKEKRDYQVCQKCAFHFPADQPPPRALSKNEYPNGGLHWAGFSGAVFVGNRGGVISYSV